MKTKTILTAVRLALLLAVGGCSTTVLTSCATAPASVDEPQGIPQVEAYSNTTFAVWLGLSVTKTPQHGLMACDGADLDAYNMGADAHRAGVEYNAMLIDSAGRWSAWVDSIIGAGTQMVSNDLLCVGLSTHGGQVIAHGDPTEPDGLNETVVYYDQVVVDNRIGGVLASNLPPHSRLAIWSDTCHAESNWRDWPVVNKFVPPRKVTPPVIVDAPEFIAKDIQVIQIAMCAASQSSYGDAETGGVGTYTWRKTVAENPGLGLWPLFVKFWSAMPDDQKPVWTQSANVTDQFKYAVPFN